MEEFPEVDRVIAAIDEALLDNNSHWYKLAIGALRYRHEIRWRRAAYEANRDRSWTQKLFGLGKVSVEGMMQDEAAAMEREREARLPFPSFGILSYEVLGPDEGVEAVEVPLHGPLEEAQNAALRTVVLTRQQETGVLKNVQVTVDVGDGLAMPWHEFTEPAAIRHMQAVSALAAA